VENVAYKKDSWINNKRQFKRHIRNQWTRGHASRAVDGDQTVATQTCTVLDNFYVERPTLLVDLGQKTRVSGVKIVTWQGRSDGSTIAGGDFYLICCCLWPRSRPKFGSLPIDLCMTDDF
jgi:hypothetical protein